MHKVKKYFGTYCHTPSQWLLGHGHRPHVWCWWCWKSFWASALGKLLAVWSLVPIGKILIRPFHMCSQKMMIAYVDMFGMRMKLGKPRKFQCTWIVFEDFTVNVGFSANNLKTFVLHLLNKKHDGKDILQGLRHGDVFSFGCGKSNLGLQFWCPNDWTVCIEDNPTASRFFCAQVAMSKLLVPSSGEVGVAIAFKTFCTIRLKPGSDVTSLFQITNKIASCFSMWFPRVWRVLCELVRGINDVGLCSLSQIVEFANQGSVVKIQGVFRLIKMSMKVLVGLGRNGLDFGIL